MSIKLEKNIYGLSEGVYDACLFLGLKFPSEVKQTDEEHLPSDYFGDDFEFDSTMIKKISTKTQWFNKVFEQKHKFFDGVYKYQKCFPKHTKTDSNIFFCDYALHSAKKLFTEQNYFTFKFYKKPFELRDTFMSEVWTYAERQVTYNEKFYERFVDNKELASKMFADFFNRDCLDVQNCTFVEFKKFVEKHQRFILKPFVTNQGTGIQVVEVSPDENLEVAFANFKTKKALLEELVIQHDEIAKFCPDTVNTIRIDTILDMHGIARIVATCGRFGRIGYKVDNWSKNGFAAVIDPKTGIIISDGFNKYGEVVQVHPDTGIKFKGFQYPCWSKICSTVKKMVKKVPQVGSVGWDMTVNKRNEVVLIESNVGQGVNIEQSPDLKGILNRFKPLVEEMQDYKQKEMQLLGYRVNDIGNFATSYDPMSSRTEVRLKFTIGKLISDCTSLIDLGCRKNKPVKSLCPQNVKYYPVDYIKHDEEVIAWDFVENDLPPPMTADTLICAFTAEYAEVLPQFLSDMCNMAQKQILILSRPIDKEIYKFYRWNNPFPTDFTEKFLLEKMEQNNFKLNAQYPMPDNATVILYDFRKKLSEPMFTVDCAQMSINIKTFY